MGDPSAGPMKINFVRVCAEWKAFKRTVEKMDMLGPIQFICTEIHLSACQKPHGGMTGGGGGGVEIQ